jgi:FlaA1/EpsC-like NDP-sugar epimerase
MQEYLTFFVYRLTFFTMLANTQLLNDASAADSKQTSVNYSDRVVIVTGGTGGIGGSVALRFARIGATTIGIGRSERKAAELR